MIVLICVIFCVSAFRRVLIKLQREVQEIYLIQFKTGLNLVWVPSEFLIDAIGFVVFISCV